MSSNPTSAIADHLFIPQSARSNMCVCGEPSSTHASVPNPVVTSFNMETSAGGIPITLCSCGLLIYQPMARIHMQTCASYRKTLRAETLP